VLTIVKAGAACGKVSARAPRRYRISNDESLSLARPAEIGCGGPKLAWASRRRAGRGSPLDAVLLVAAVAAVWRLVAVVP